LQHLRELSRVSDVEPYFGQGVTAFRGGSRRP
jgi:hypothetical protein